MRAREDETSQDDPRLNEILVQYFQATEGGESPDEEMLLERHPEFADQLREFFADKRQIDNIAKPSFDEDTRPVQPAGGTVDMPTMAPSAPTSPGADEATLAPGHAGRDAATGDSPQVGCKVRYFGDYELLEEIARGGMGVVYKARQVSLNRIVALKMILSGQLAGEDDVKRFYTEAEAAANLDHPGIVPIFEVGEHEGRHYYSMGFVDGQSLADLLEDGPLPPSEAAEYTRKIAEAIAFAHEHGVIHRDLKPANVLLQSGDRRPESGGKSASPHPPTSSLQTPVSRLQPKITDFGLAKKTAGDTNLTATGQILGTPSYMPQEQASGAKEIGPAADIYALGGILYALLTGSPPFRADNELDALLQVLESEPTPPRQVNRAVDRNLETICLKCLEKDPQRRYGSALELAEDLGRYLEGEAIVARPLGPWGRLNRWARRYPALAATLVALLLFYANHLIAFVVLKAPGEGEAFHTFVTVLALVWAGGAAAFQYMARRPNAGAAVTYGWAGMDVLLFTVLLWGADGPRSSVLFGYLLLVAGAGLRFRIGLVWFVTALCMTGYIGLVIEAYRYRHHVAAPPQSILPFLMCLAIMGLIVHFTLRRIRRINASDSTCTTLGRSRTGGALSRRSLFGRTAASDS